MSTNFIACLIQEGKDESLFLAGTLFDWKLFESIGFFGIAVGDLIFWADFDSSSSYSTMAFYSNKN